MAQSSPLSYQTTMPEYPDTSYEAYINYYYPQGVGATSRVGNWFDSTFGYIPSWNEWRTVQMDDYNAKMSAYNTWLSTGEGISASAESGGYNKSYFQAGSASASPLNYQQASSESPFTPMAQGVAGIFQFVKALQGMKLMSAQIAGQEAKNKAQNLINDQLADQLRWKNTVLFNQANLLGYRSDSQAFQNMIHFAPVFKDTAEKMAALSKVPSDAYIFTPFEGGKSYNFNNYDKALAYQRAYQDIEFIKSGTKLRNIQYEIAGFTKKERQFYVNSIQQVYKEFLDNQLALAKGQLSFQPIEQKLRKQATQWGIGLNAANTAIQAAKAVVGMLTPAGAAANAMSGVPSWGNLPNQSQSWGSGWDATTGAWINPYNGYY